MISNNVVKKYDSRKMKMMLKIIYLYDIFHFYSVNRYNENLKKMTMQLFS